MSETIVRYTAMTPAKRDMLVNGLAALKCRRGDSLREAERDLKDCESSQQNVIHVPTVKARVAALNTELDEIEALQEDLLEMEF